MRVQIIIISIVVLILSACSTVGQYPTTTRSNQPMPLKYPHVKQESSTIIKNPSGFNTYITVFKTSDTSDIVIKFYKDHLTNMGWIKPIQKGDEYLSLLNMEACPLYSFYLTTDKAEPALTSVEIRLVPETCSGG